jgi:hypothetical protein
VGLTAVEEDWRRIRESILRRDKFRCSNARSRAIEAKLIFITYFRDLPAVAMSHQIWLPCATAAMLRIILNSQPDWLAARSNNGQ